MEMKNYELINHLQIASSIKQTFKKYLSDIFDDISSSMEKKKGAKTLDLISFHDFLDFPMLFSEKVFNAFCNDNSDELDRDQFVEGMQGLFCVSSIDSFTKLIFRICDFKVRGLAMIYNFKVLLTQMHIRIGKNADTASLIEIINKSLGEDHSVSLTFSFFISKIAENADVVYLFLSYVYKYFHKEKECVQYYSKIICKAQKNCSDSDEAGINDEDDKNGQTPFSTLKYKYGLPTKRLMKYLKDELSINFPDRIGNNLESSDTSCDDLSQLDEFENEIESCMLVNSIESPYRPPLKSISNGELKYKSMNMSPFFVLESTISSNSANTNSSSNNGNSNTNANSTSSNSNENNKPKISKHHSSNAAWGLSTFKLNPNIFASNNINGNNSTHNSFLCQSISQTCSKSHFNQTKEFICTYCPNESNELIKVKMILIGNNLFFFHYSDQSYCYIYEGFHFLRKNYIEKTQEIINEQFKVTLTSDYGGKIKTDQIYFEDKSQCDFFYEEFIQAINYKHIKDDILFLQEINAGNFGTIFSGFSNKLNKKVCIKKISKREKDKPELKLIRWEKDVTEYLIKITHKNVMQAYAIYEDDAFVYLVLEYIEGVSLSVYSFKNDIDKKSITHQIIESLIFLHKNSIIHRDIKHDNIMIRNNGTSYVKLVDFGFARILSKFDSAREYCGSISFTAPEIILNHPYGCTVDVWSLGVLLFWMSYRILPFRSQNNDTKKVSEKILKGVLSDPLDGCFTDKLLMLCLKREPKERSSLRNLLDLFSN